ncbi:sigma factor [Spirillospora sp. CA-253888]
MDLPLTAAVPPRAAPTDVGALYREHAAGLIRLAMLMVGDAPTAEDVVQDAFLGLHRHRDALRDPDGALAYVRSAVLNRCRSALRRRAVAGALRFYCDLPEEEIARTLRISRGTVSSTTSRALRSLEQILGADS